MKTWSNNSSSNGLIDTPYLRKTVSRLCTQKSRALQQLKHTVDGSPEGYAQVATFQSSDRNFLQYRGFAYLHCRVLSDLQNGIEQLEQELDTLDQHDKDNGGLQRLKSRRHDSELSEESANAKDYPEYIPRSRPEVLRTLKEKLLEYGKLLSGYAESCRADWDKTRFC